MKFDIPVSKIDQLDKLLNRVLRKGAPITYTKGAEVIRTGSLHIRDPRTYTERSIPIEVRCIEVEVSGVYKIADWEFVGTVEHTEHGNIIRLANPAFEGRVPERYNHTDTICEHCHTHRVRKDTYLIYNSKTDDFKQVGRNCMLDYTQGLDAEICANIMSSLDKFAYLGSCEFGSDEFFNLSNPVSAGINSYTVKKYALALIKAFGYRKSGEDNSTIENLVDVLFYREKSDRLRDLEPIDDKELFEEITKYALAVTDTYGYMYNAKVAWLNEYVEMRDFGLIASFIYVYLREQERKVREARQAQESHHIGNVGDRIEFEVQEYKVAYYNEMFGTFYYIIKDTKGNTICWSTGTCIEEGMRIKATVKEHSEYRGVKQTVITRGRIISE